MTNKRQQHTTYTQIYLDLDRRVNAGTSSALSRRRVAKEKRSHAIAEDYLAGMRLVDLMEKYKVTKPTIYSDLRKRGITLRRDAE